MKTYSFKIKDFTHKTRQILKRHTLNTINPTTLFNLFKPNTTSKFKIVCFVFQSKNKLITSIFTQILLCYNCVYITLEKFSSVFKQKKLNDKRVHPNIDFILKIWYPVHRRMLPRA